MDSANPRWKVLHGNCLDVLKTLPDNSIDAVVSDPPYGLSEHTDIQTMVRYWFVGKEFVNKSAGFMGKDWDAFVPGPEIWREVKRVLKPGGYLLAFSGSRTMDLMGISIRFAGFDMKETVMAWVYGSGFPKGLNISKAIDKAAGAEREITAPATDAARQWDGWNTALKPAFEPVLVAQKPFEGTIAENVLTHGTGALNIDGCRVAFQSDADKESAFPAGKLTSHGSGSLAGPGAAQDAERDSFSAQQSAKGRWPPNVLLTHHPDCVEGEECHPECGTKLMDAQSGIQKSGVAVQRNGGGQKIGGNGIYAGSNGLTREDSGYGDSGGASRFFPQFYYSPKASRSEREAGLEASSLPEQRRSTDYGAMRKRRCNVCGTKAAARGAGGKWPNCEHDDWEWVEQDAEGVKGGNAKNVHPCLVPGTLVLTSNGWKSIDTVSPGELVLGADGELHPVVEVSSHDCAGPVFRVRVDGVDAYVDATGNHPFLVLRDGAVLWVEARLLKKGDCTLTPANVLDTVKPVWENQAPKASTLAETAQPPRRDTTESGTKAVSEWPTMSSGSLPTDPSQKGTGYTTETRTSRTIAFATSNWSMPLHTSGCTLVASSVTEFGGSPAECAGYSNLLTTKTGTSPERAGLHSEDAARATSESSLPKSVFAANEVLSVEETPYQGPVWNLTVLGNPTFQTQVGMTHNTVKPINVMRWLIKLVTPPGGVVLDPFNGSGTTGCAAMYEGCEYVGIEREAEYVEIAKARIAYAESQSEAKAKPALKTAQPEAVSLEGLPVPDAPAPKATKTLDEAALKKLVAKTLKKRR